MKEYDIKLIALDLDRTTLDSAGRLSARTKNTLEAAIKKGVHVVIATGRARTALPEDVCTIKGVRYIVTANGACITDMKDNSIVYSNCIDAGALENTVELLRGYNFMYEFFIEGQAYVEKAVYDKIGTMNFGEKHKKYILETRKPVEGLLDFALMHKSLIENINLNFENQGDRSMMREVIGRLENVTITSSFDHNLEIGGATTSKADALNTLCGKYGTAPENVMACGDSPNDIAMLKAAGLSVAMGNAKDEVKAAAMYVAASNDEDGVAEAVEKFVLKNEID